MLLVEWLLDLEELKQLIIALFGFLIAFLEDFMHSLFPQWTSDLGGSIGIRCTVLLIDDLAVCTLDEKVTNQSCRLRHFRCENAKMKRRSSLDVLGIDFGTPGKNVAESKLVSTERCPMQWCTGLGILHVDIHSKLLYE